MNVHDGKSTPKDTEGKPAAVAAPHWFFRPSGVKPVAAPGIRRTAMKNRNFVQRLGFAIAGVLAGWRRERSFRTHGIFAVLAVLALLILRPAPVWWALVALAAALVMALELVNSAVETVIDHLHPERHEEMRIAKDMLAGAVLLVSLAALVVALMLVIASAPKLAWPWL